MTDSLCFAKSTFRQSYTLPDTKSTTQTRGHAAPARERDCAIRRCKGPKTLYVHSIKDDATNAGGTYVDQEV
jgi:hypothetical protein